MSHKRPTESSWDSDDDILEDDVSNAFASEKDEEFDEDALLGPIDGEEDDLEGQFSQDGGGEETLDTETYQDGDGNDFLEIEVDADFEEEEEEKGEGVPVLELPDTSEFDEEPDQFQGSSFEEPSHYEEPVQSEDQIEENTYEKELETDTTQEFDDSVQEDKTIEDITTENIKEEEDDDDDDDDEESDNEDSGRRGRFISERAGTISLKRSTADAKKAIPDTLELSQADQKKIDDFMTDRQNHRGGRGGRGRMNNRGRGMPPFGQRPRDNNFRPRGPFQQQRYQFQPRPQHFERPQNFDRPPYMGQDDNINMQHNRPRADFMPPSRPVEPLMSRDNFNKPVQPQRQHPLDFFEKAQQQRVQQPRKILINPNFRGTVQLQGNAVLTPAWSGQNIGIRGDTGVPQFPAPQNNQQPNRSQDFREDINFQGRPFIDNNRGPVGQNQQQTPMSRPNTSQGWVVPPLQQPPRQMFPSRSQSASTFTPAPIPQQPLVFTNNQQGMNENQQFQPMVQNFNRPNGPQNNQGFPQRSNSAGDIRFQSSNIEGSQMRHQFPQQNNRMLGPQGGRPFQDNGPGPNQRLQHPQGFNQPRPGVSSNGNNPPQFSHEQQRFNQPYRPQHQAQLQPFQQQQLPVPQQHNQQQHPRYQPPGQPNMQGPRTSQYQEYQHESEGEPIRTIGSPPKPLVGQKQPLSQRPQFQNDQQPQQQIQQPPPNSHGQLRPNQPRPQQQAWQNNNNQMQRQTSAQIAANRISKNAQKRRSGEQQIVTTPEKKTRMSVKNRLGNKQPLGASEKQEEKKETSEKNKEPPVAETKLAPELGVDEEYAKKLEQQKRLREEVRKKKELRRLATAGPRRQELAEKLAQKGMTLDDAAKGVPKQPEPLMKVQTQTPTPTKTLPLKPTNTITASVQGQQNQTVKRMVVSKKKLNELMQQGYNLKIMNKGKKIQPASNLVGQPIQPLNPSNQQRIIQSPSVKAPGVRPQQRQFSGGNPGQPRRFPGPIQKRAVAPTATQTLRKVVNPGQDGSNGGRRVVVAGGNALVSNTHGTKLVGIENLSASTTSKRLHQLCGNVGPTEVIQMNNSLRKAVVKFVNPQHANVFAQKFNRKMVDLSMISVALLQEND